MSLFKRKKNQLTVAGAPAGAIPNYSALAELTLNAITDGVLLVDENGLIKFANPAAAEMVGYGRPNNMIGLSFETVLKLENAEGMLVPPEQTKLTQFFVANQPLTTREYILVSMQAERRAAISLSLTPTGGPKSNKIITFRDITKELEEEEKQSEFISTASHEMRTPVASIEGYLGLALNPQTATIDDRAKQYLESAHKASQHLGHLFKDLLDVTRLDDGHAKLHLVPVEMVAVVKDMAGSREKDMLAKHLKYSFGSAGGFGHSRLLDQVVYAAVDLDFLREILDNLIDNAIKYTPEGGEIWVGARGDGDKVLINVTDTGIGVSPEDAGHIFQKFYRVDNSQTRQIGGTGLGLYLVKQRAEAMGGRVWVESAFGDGSTFFVSLPRLSAIEYEKRRIAYQNEQVMQAFAESNAARNSATATASAPVAAQMSQGVTTAAVVPAQGVAMNAPVAAPPAPTSNIVATNPANQVAPAEAVGGSGAAVAVATNVTAAPTEVLRVRETQTTPAVPPANSGANIGASPPVSIPAQAVPTPQISPPVTIPANPVNPALSATPAEATNPVYQSINHN